MIAFFHTALFEHLFSTLLAALSVFGCVLPICRILYLPVNLLHLAGYSLLFCGVISLCSLRRSTRWIDWVLTILFVSIFGYTHLPALRTCLLAYTTLSGDASLNALAVHMDTLLPLVCLLLARLLTRSLCTNSTLVGIHFVFMLILPFICNFLAPQLDLVSLLPLFASLIFLLRYFFSLPPSVGRVIPSAALCLLCAMLFLPNTLDPYPPLSDLMQRTRQFIEDHFLFTQSRTVYSLSMSGYQPFGHERLGGPVDPTDDPVMEVETDETVLLRGVISNEYTGFSWRNTLPANRYLLSDLRFQGLRKKTFDLNLPAQALRDESSIFDEKALRIRMVKDCFSTLFVPARTQSLSASEGIVPYFSPSSEIFITRDLSSGDSYSVSAPIFSAETPGVAQLVECARQNADSNYDEIAANYTAVPDLVEHAVYQLSYVVTQNAQTPFEKAQLLCDFLLTRYSYTYDQNVPPDDRDFVSWFLLDEKQGYCVSFASSMAVMGRIVGLPTRYIEGYVAHPAADGIARVTDLAAHAWVEVYFSGFGWVAFDPTPGSTSADDTSTDTQDDPTQSGDAPPTPTPPADAPGAADQPTSSPTPSPTPDSDNSGENTPPPAEADAPTPTPPPAAEQRTPTPPPVAPQDEPDPPDDDSAPPLSLLLLLLLLAAAVAARLYTAQPSFAAARARHPGAQVLIYYRAILTELSCMHLTRMIDESPIRHAVRVWHALDGQDSRDLTGIVQAARIVSAAQYSLHTPPQRADADFLATVYLRLLKRMTLLQKLRLYALRLIKGAGSIKSI